MGMKQILLMMAAVVVLGCGKKKDPNTGVVNPNKPSLKAIPEKLITDPIVEKAVRKSLKKPEGELTEADLGNVIELILADTQITDEGLKEMAKLQKLKMLRIRGTKVTKAGVAELKKALPNCQIDGP